MLTPTDLNTIKDTCIYVANWFEATYQRRPTEAEAELIRPALTKAFTKRIRTRYRYRLIGMTMADLEASLDRTLTTDEIRVVIGLVDRHLSEPSAPCRLQ